MYKQLNSLRFKRDKKSLVSSRVQISAFSQQNATQAVSKHTKVLSTQKTSLLALGRKMHKR
jgi:hypothetical protein